MRFNFSKKNSLEPVDETTLEKNLVWIFASPRSGTSWLGNQLLDYNTKSMDEPYIGHHLESVGIAQNRKKFIDFHKQRNDYFFCDAYQDVWKYYLRKLFLNRIHVQFNDLKHKIIIKEPNGSLGADNILSCLQDSKWILVLRDGRDVIDSLVDARQKGGWSTNMDLNPLNPKNRLSFITHQANLWISRTSLLLKLYEEDANKKLCHVVKYEDLLKNTSSELKKIYDFIGIDIPEDKLDKIVQKHSFQNIPDNRKGSGQVTRSATPGKWQENFNEEEKKILNQIMGPMLRKFGY